jgi:hypothetical protein
MSLSAHKSRRILPNWSATANEKTEQRARATMLKTSPYKNGHRLPKTFKQMRESFWRDGVPDAVATRKAGAWIKSQRKIRNQATLYFDEIWSGLHRVANECKKGANNLEEAHKRYNQFAITMAVVIKPLIEDNLDDLNEHDYGAPLSDAGMGCVEAAWAGKTPYD